jgi:hypothetical protein
MSGLCGEGSRDLFIWRTAMKIIILFTVLILIFPVSIFGSEVNSIIKQQREKKQKQVESENREKRYHKTLEQCINKTIDIAALKFKELMDKGVEFEKPHLYENYFEDIGGKRYAVYNNYGTLVKYPLRVNLFNDKFIAMKKIIYIQPKDGKNVQISLRNLESLTGCELSIFVHSSGNPGNSSMKFNSIDEIEKKLDMINNNIVKAIEAAVK